MSNSATRTLWTIVLLAPVGVLVGQPAPTPPPIRFPEYTTPTPEPKPPVTVEVNRLGPDRLYVIDSDVPCVVLASPAELVKITAETGPIKISGLFVDNVKRTTRTYSGKYVFVVEAAGTGKVELLVIPNGFKVEADIIRKILDVDNGTGPRPPPDPNPPVPPDPKPSPAPIPGDGLRVLIVYETGIPMPAGQFSAIFGKDVRGYLDTHAKEYRVYDQNTDITHAPKVWQDAMKRPRASVPWIIVSDGKTGYEGPMPANVRDTLTLLKKYGGE